MINVHLPSELALLLHQAFEMLAIFVGVQLYRSVKVAENSGSIFSSERFPVVMGAILGAALGNKTLYWLYHPELFYLLRDNPLYFLSGGQTLVGGLIGGLLGVEIAKKISRIHRSTGDQFVAPLLIAIAIGRIGCFLAGLKDETYGVATSLPWAVNYGDGVNRHPVPLYEMIFVLVLLCFLKIKEKEFSISPGLQFKLMFCAYLFWRFCVDEIKVKPEFTFLQFTSIQWACLVSLLFYAPITAKQFNHYLAARVDLNDSAKG